MTTLTIMSSVLIGAAVILVIIRLLIGPTISDRIMALDTFTTITATFIAFAALLFGRPVYMDVALVYAVIGFVGTVFVAKFVERDV